MELNVKQSSKISCTTSQQEFKESSPLIKSMTSSENIVRIEGLKEGGKELRRNLGFKHAFVFIVGILFGSGIFISPGLVAKETSNMGMAVIVWIISGIPCLLGALCICELACMYGKTGGVYIYLLEAYGKFVGFIYIWMRALLIAPVGLAAPAIAIGEHILEPFYDIKSAHGIWYVKAIALFALLLPTIINCASTNMVGKLQAWFTLIQIISVCFIVVLGIWRVSTGHIANYAVMFNNSSDFNIGNFGIALYNGLWGYEGWGIAASVSEELENVERNLWLAIATGIPFVVLCYVLVNLALMSALSHDEMANSSTVATTFVEKILGKKVALIMPFAVALSCFCSINGSQFMLARMLLSAAREGQVPYALCFIHKERRTPIPAVIAFFILSAFWIMLPGVDIQSLISIFSFGIWLQYCLAIFSVILMRVRKPDLPRPFKVSLINPIFTGIIGLFLVTIPFVNRPVESTICLGTLLSGLPAYFIFIKKYDILPSFFHKTMDNLSAFLKKRCNLVPCIFIAEDSTIDECTHNQLGSSLL